MHHLVGRNFLRERSDGGDRIRASSERAIGERWGRWRNAKRGRAPTTDGETDKAFDRRAWKSTADRKEGKNASRAYPLFSLPLPPRRLAGVGFPPSVSHTGSALSDFFQKKVSGWTSLIKNSYVCILLTYLGKPCKCCSTSGSGISRKKLFNGLFKKSTTLYFYSVLHICR
jgi:hypothetical protein